MRFFIHFLLITFGVLTALPGFAAEPPGKFQSIYVDKVVVVAEMDTTNPEEVKYYTDLEAEATTMLRKFFVGEGYRVSDAPDPADSKQLTINTRALFNAGNRALRWVGGIVGAGKASADVTMEAVVTSSGEAVSSRRAENTMRMGGFGGSAPGLLMGVIDTAWNGVVSDIQALK